MSFNIKSVSELQDLISFVRSQGEQHSEKEIAEKVAEWKGYQSTDALVARLVEPTECPECGSKDIDAGDVNTDCDVVFRQDQCEGCGEKWENRYALDHTELVENNGE